MKCRERRDRLIKTRIQPMTWCRRRRRCRPLYIESFDPRDSGAEDVGPQDGGAEDVGPRDFGAEDVSSQDIDESQPAGEPLPTAASGARTLDCRRNHLLTMPDVAGKG